MEPLPIGIAIAVLALAVSACGSPVLTVHAPAAPASVTSPAAPALTGNALACHRFAGISGALDGILATVSAGSLPAASAETLMADSADLDRWAKGAGNTVSGTTVMFLGGDMAAAALALAAVGGAGGAKAALVALAGVAADCTQVVGG